MQEEGDSAYVSPSYLPLIVFKPRQVLLAEEQQRNSSMAKKQSENSAQLKPDNKSLLAYSIALWIENSGFSKALKRFISEAQIQDDDWKLRALNLEDVFSKYLELCNDHNKNLFLQKDQKTLAGDAADKNGNSNCAALEEIISKKKKSKRKDKYNDISKSDSGKTLCQSQLKSEAPKNSSDGKVCELLIDESSRSQKVKKKKGKFACELLDGDEKQIDARVAATGQDAGDIPSEENKFQAKQKKRKKEATASPELSGSEMHDSENPILGKPKQKSIETAEDRADEYSKASKKRKRFAPYENENHPFEEVAVEELKRRKTGGLEELKVVEQQITISGGNGLAEPQNFSVKKIDESTNGNIHKNELKKSSQPKSGKRQHNSSVEPKTVNAFQRVKVDDVKYVDERLQDNSYWALDSAGNGYGAKAQEVLGQVKGRDFRHEKTKKKRGSYRGGQIDLQSHSIKFNYSDED
ncbi:unnamed protein product [Fraxinus pennsylvanica]|uniref:Srp40 C-terminal domain-containing protein n=1 Tax=Fraxinus pennsylvanica TaxID=56036 RepID=A0AAD1Z5R2_9LAMI|nr:unnamed protein product [Fraxinus pennsylvanica]